MSEGLSGVSQTEEVLPPNQENFIDPENTPVDVEGVFAELQELSGEVSTPVLDEVKRAIEELNQGLERTPAEVAEIESLLERAAFLDEHQKGLRERFWGKVSKALLPVITALTFSSSPAFGHQAEAMSQRGIENNTHATFQVKDKKPEAAVEVLSGIKFDAASVLNTGGENIVRTKEELAHLKDLMYRVWERQNEWVSVTGVDKEGNFVSDLHEVGPSGGNFDFGGLEDELQKTTLRHTHPVSLYSASDEGKKPFIMGPSIGDMSTCFLGHKFDSQEVVDPRGVWRYSCDREGVYHKKITAVKERMSSALESLFFKYNVTKEDLNSIDISTVHPSESSIVIIESLDKKYPQMKHEFYSVRSSLVQEHFDILKEAANYESRMIGLVDFSRDAKNSDEDISIQMKDVISKAKAMGVTLSYQPYKK